MARSHHLLMSAALLLSAGAVGCSSDSGASGAKNRATPVPTVTSADASAAYEAAVLADGARALFPLRDADGLAPGDRVSDVGPTRRAATVIGGPVSGTTSPFGSRAALFLRGGRVTTALSSGLAGTDTFSLEVVLRADACTTAWGRVLATSSYGSKGREGLDVLHYPSQFQQSACRIGVELWHDNVLQAGCYPEGVPTIGRWTHLAVVYGDRTVTCYRDGVLVESQKVKGAVPFAQPGPLGLGGAGSGYQGPADGVSLSEVAVYARALSAQQVRAHVRLLQQAAAAAATPTGPAPAPATPKATATRPVVGPPVPTRS